MGIKREDGFRDFVVKRLDFVGFTSCENFKSYCRPILRGVKETEKNLVFAFYFFGFFQYWSVKKLMYRAILRLNKISRFPTFLPTISGLFFSWFLLLLPIFF